MPYSTLQDVERAAGGEQDLIDLTDLDRSNVINSDLVDGAILAADSWINGYVAKQRSVPLFPVPELIRRASIAEALYLLKLDRGTVNERDHEARINREAYLRDIALGRTTLGVDAQPMKSALVAPTVVEIGDDDREHTAANLKGFW